MKTIIYSVFPGLVLAASIAAADVLIRTSEPIVSVSGSASFSLSNPPPYDLTSQFTYPFVNLYFNPNIGTLESVTADFEVSIPVFVVGTSQSVFAAGDIEMNLRGVLPKSRGHHVFSLFNCHPVHVIDLFADLVVSPAMGLADRREVVGGEVQTLRNRQSVRRDERREIGRYGIGCGRVGVSSATQPASSSTRAIAPGLAP